MKELQEKKYTKYESPMVPLPIYNMVKPTNAHKFLIHLLLSMGKFKTELDLFRSHNLKKCFIDSGLLREPTSQNLINKDHINYLIKKYLLKQLFYLPCGTLSMDRFCCQLIMH